MVYINSTGKHNEVWLDKPYATITVECPECPSTEDAYSSGYTDGSEEGYHKGYQSGSTDGWGAGYPSGYTDGYDSGYTDGQASVDCTEFYNSGVTDGIAEQKSKLVSTAITENGTYTKEDGFSSVEVNVPTGQTINNQNKSAYIDNNQVQLVYTSKTDSYNYQLIGNYLDYTYNSGYTGLNRLRLRVDINASEAIELGYDSGYTSGYTDGVNSVVCSGGNEDLIANLQGDYFVIPEGTTKIRTYAFRKACFSAITIPSSVRTIESYAFAENNCLEEIVIPSSVEVLDKDVFYNCRNLTAATFENSGLTSFGEELFVACHALIEVELPAALNNLPTGTFSNCRALSSITIPSGVTAIGTACFNNCNSLSTITIPAGVTDIGDDCFYNCCSLNTITIPSAVTRIGGNCFYGDSGMSSMVFESTTPPQLAGDQYWNLSLGSSAYTWPIYVPCEAVDTYKTAWPYYAHRIMCDSGDTPDTGTSMLNLIYETTEPDQTISLFHGETPTNDWFGLFFSALTAIEIDGVTETPDASNIQVRNSVSSYTHTFAVAGRHQVKLTLTDGYTDALGHNPAKMLKELLFSRELDGNLNNLCPLVEANIGKGYEVIYFGAFTDQHGLTGLTLPDTLTTLSGYPFEATGLIDVTIPENVTAIGHKSFYNCSAITAMVFEGLTPPTLSGTEPLGSTAYTFPIYVPASAVSTYQNEPSWADYASRVQAKP